MVSNFNLMQGFPYMQLLNLPIVQLPILFICPMLPGQSQPESPLNNFQLSNAGMGEWLDVLLL